MEMLQNHRQFKNFLISRSLLNHNDEVTVFLSQALSEIPYIQNLQGSQRNQIIRHLAFTFEPIFYEPDYLIYDKDLEEEI